jgi:hypothetical protein
MIHDIFVEQEGERFESHGKMLRLSASPAAYAALSHDLIPATIYLAIGELDESTIETTFIAPLEQQFAVEAQVLVDALVALKILPTNAAVTNEFATPEKDYAA